MPNSAWAAEARRRHRPSSFLPLRLPVERPPTDRPIKASVHYTLTAWEAGEWQSVFYACCDSGNFTSRMQQQCYYIVDEATKSEILLIPLPSLGNGLATTSIADTWEHSFLSNLPGRLFIYQRHVFWRNIVSNWWFIDLSRLFQNISLPQNDMLKTDFIILAVHAIFFATAFSLAWYILIN